jgi:hypothetical protein
MYTWIVNDHKMCSYIDIGFKITSNRFNNLFFSTLDYNAQIIYQYKTAKLHIS